jgi:hypothetical protein
MLSHVASVRYPPAIFAPSMSVIEPGARGGPIPGIEPELSAATGSFGEVKQALAHGLRLGQFFGRMAFLDSLLQ